MDQDSNLPDFISSAQEAIQTIEIQEIIKKISSFGLGVFIPHMHPEERGFAELPAGMVSLEKNLNVTFVNQEEITGESIAVGWRWDEELQTVSACKQRPKFYHH